MNLRKIAAASSMIAVSLTGMSMATAHAGVPHNDITKPLSPIVHTDPSAGFTWYKAIRATQIYDSPRVDPNPQGQMSARDRIIGEHATITADDGTEWIRVIHYDQIGYVLKSDLRQAWLLP